jgi:prolyl-tRNA editing enzyme YbaK/EbsC (Cys-tRNA(Pro) deacylase)
MREIAHAHACQSAIVIAAFNAGGQDMTKQDLSKMAEAALVALFCLAGVYVTVSATIFGGTPPVVRHTVDVVTHRLISFQAYIKRNAGAHGRLVMILPQDAFA